MNMKSPKYLVVDKTTGATIQGCDDLSKAIALVAELLREGRQVRVVNTTTKSKEDTVNHQQIQDLEKAIEFLHEQVDEASEGVDAVIDQIANLEAQLMDRQIWAADAATKPKYCIAFTGHRPPKIGGYDNKNPLRVAVKDAIGAVLDRAVAKYGKTHQIVIISGGALGVDQDAARVAHKMGLPFIVAAPCRNQDSKWPKQSQERYNKMLGLAMNVVYVHDGPYRDGCLNKRNEWMVDHCDALVAVWDGSPGGTAHCVKYAKSAGKPIVMINPKNLNKEVK